MKSKGRPPGTQDARSDFERLHTALLEAVVACRVQSGKHQVHALRTGTRKLEALLRKALEDHPGAAELNKTAGKARRELKRVRKAAGPVRDLDVQRDLIQELEQQFVPEQRGADQPGPGGRKAAGHALAGESKELDRSLRKRRKQSATHLEKLLKRRELRLERALEATAQALGSLTAVSPEPVQTAAKWTRRLATEKLDPGARSFQDDLHGYRKHTKAARYVASLQESSSQARQLAESLKKTQDSIGRWHDLMLLGDEAAELLGSRSELATLLRNRQKIALDSATDSLPGSIRSGAGEFRGT